jgi:hypothetical protein
VGKHKPFCSNYKGPKFRLFNVVVESKSYPELTNLDLYVLGGNGYNRAITIDVPNVVVTDGFLTIALFTIADHAQISAIEIVPA